MSKTTTPMAPHRQTRILFLLICFALQIPAIIAMWIFGVSEDYAPLVVLIPIAGFGLTLISRRRRA